MLRHIYIHLTNFSLVKGEINLIYLTGVLDVASLNKTTSDTCLVESELRKTFVFVSFTHNIQ
jgi:hypothetical protein